MSSFGSDGSGGSKRLKGGTGSDSTPTGSDSTPTGSGPSRELATLDIPLRTAYSGGIVSARTSHGRRITIPVLAGIAAGSRLCLWNSNPEKDTDYVYVTIEGISRQRPFTLQGRDLHVTLPIPRRIAVRGGVIRVPTPDGSVKLRILPGTCSGASFTLQDWGLPHFKDHSKNGKLVITLVSPFPLNLWARAQIHFRRMRTGG